MKIKDTRTIEEKILDREILRKAQRILEDLKIDTLFGDSKENFLYATLSEGLSIVLRQSNNEIWEARKGDDEQ
mgnify:CR=1 FL=1